MNDRVDVAVRFAPVRVVAAPDGGMRVAVATDANRGDAQLAARLHRPGVVRDALMALGDALGSDLRRKANDRADYLAVSDRARQGRLEGRVGRAEGVSRAAIRDRCEARRAARSGAHGRGRRAAHRGDVARRVDVRTARVASAGGTGRCGSPRRFGIARTARAFVALDAAAFAAIAPHSRLSHDDARVRADHRRRSNATRARADALAARVRPDASRVAARRRSVRAVAGRSLQRAARAAHAQGEDRAARTALRARAG